MLRETIDTENVVPQLSYNLLGSLVLAWKGMGQFCEVVSHYKYIHGAFVPVFC